MRSQRLDPLLKVVQERQDAVARELADRDRALAEQQARLDALQRYAAEYATPAATVTHPALLANRLAFRERLDAAVAEQSKVVDHSRLSCDVERARLMLASRDTHVLEKLAASYRAEEHRHAERRGQRELDDLGARRARARLADETESDA
ncbi:flagellar export protein FliJ [Lysobacter olei]